MPDTKTPTSETEPAAPAETKTKRRRARAVVNRDYTGELQSSRKVAASALDAKYAPTLAIVDFDATLPAQVTTLVSQVDTALGQLKGTRAARKNMTVQETNARRDLLGVLQPIQTAARRKFGGDQATLREAYYIGESLSKQSLDDVLTAARAVLARLSPGENDAPPVDVLPGIKPGQEIKALADAITHYGGRDQAQGEHQREAEGALEDIEVTVETLAGLRRQIQLAADQAWPWRTPKSATIRKAFLLPTDRPFAP